MISSKLPHLKPYMALIPALLAWLCCASNADTLILQGGEVLSGTVLQRDDTSTVVMLDYGTVTYANTSIKTVERDDLLTKAKNAQNPDFRIPPWGEILGHLSKSSWMHSLRQIPATVVDVGVLKNVPYISFRCNAAGYQMNIYGDLDKPAGVEIGALNFYVNNDAARSNCISFITSVLPRAADKEIVRTLSRDRKSLKKNDGLTIETTMPDEADAYGGWWVSVYDEAALEKARANEAELAAITQKRVPEKSTIVQTPSPSVAPPPIGAQAPTIPNWTSQDLSYASSGASGAGGRVYVRGYQRRDGTYVHPHTRSAPRR